jgi:subtilisin family serine protease
MNYPFDNCIAFLRLAAFALLVITTNVCGATADTSPTPVLQEPFLVRINQASRRSPSFRGNLEQFKTVAQREHLQIDRWFYSEEALILRIQPPANIDGVTKEALLRRLSTSSVVELVTTASGAAGQIQPALLRVSAASDTGIPEARLRGFREIDKNAWELRMKPGAPHAKGRLIVATKEEALFGPAASATLASAAADHARLGGTVTQLLRNSGTDRIEIIRFDEVTTSVMEMVRRYHQLPWVEYAQPDYYISAVSCSVDAPGILPPDPYADPNRFDYYVYPPGTSSSERNGYHLDKICAPAAWNLQHDTNQIVAVLDTGLYTDHPDISGNVFGNLVGTNLVNSLDPNDATPPVDDMLAYDDQPISASHLSQSSGGHGTHVAGIIGAKADNNGSVGLAWSVRLLPFKVYDYTGIGSSNSGTSSQFVAAFDRAREKNAKIINCSFAGPADTAYSPGVFEAMQRARTAGIVIVAAAGNVSTDEHGGGGCGGPFDYNCEGGIAADFEDLPAITLNGMSNDDVDPVYPASSELPNVIAVSNTDANDMLHPSSRFGVYTVDVAAPGTHIISTLNQNSSNAGKPYYTLTGTSMAAPHVSGTLALVRERLLDPNGPYHQNSSQVTFWDLLDRIRMGVDQVPALQGLVSTGGRLNAYKALLARSKMANLSCRAKVETGGNIAINGFILRGPTKILIRGIGPSLGGSVSSPLSDPYLEVFDSSTPPQRIAHNNNWRDSQEADILATGLQPTNYYESAIVLDNLPAGNYTAQLSGVNGGEGIGSTEVYELSDGTNLANDLNRAVNLSSRVVVRGGEGAPIAGLIIHGDRPRRVLIRALGPSLSAYGIANGLANPQLRLFRSDGTTMALNDNWRYVAGTQLYPAIYRDKLTGFAPLSDLEPLIVATLDPGDYTVQCSGADGGEGVAVIEVYEY